MFSAEASTPVYRSVNGSPAGNVEKVVELTGGIGRIIGEDDVILLKPNAQWWNQGCPNLACLDAFVELIFHRPGGFRGEVIVGENCHRGSSPWKSQGSAWTHRFERNSDLAGVSNLGEWASRAKARFGDRFCVRHWIDVGAGGRRVHRPGQGDGYVYCDGTCGVPLIECRNGMIGASKRATVMTYPVFTSERGTVVDFKNGVWKNGSYTGQPFRFVNFAALNHHSTYCGATSAVKNYMGISDLSGGPDPKRGCLTADYRNFHSFPFDEWAPGPRAGMLGAEVGVFMRSIRRADLNVTTADWVGLASRTELPAARTSAVLASVDPVALDYHAFKYLLYANSRAAIHDPDRPDGPARQYLGECAREAGCAFDERRVTVKSFDHRSRRRQGRDEMRIDADVEWGRDPKMIAKYLVMRYWVRP
jgi:hypothetical protein